MTSFYCRRLPQALILVLFECLNGTGPTYIGSLFKYRHTPYRLRGEGLNLELPNFNLKFKKNSFTYSLTKLWNSLPSQVRLSSDANDFRSKLHDCSFLERVLQCTIVAFNCFQNEYYSFPSHVFSMWLFGRFQLFIFYVFITKFFICIYLLSCF